MVLPFPPLFLRAHGKVLYPALTPEYGRRIKDKKAQISYIHSCSSRQHKAKFSEKLKKTTSKECVSILYRSLKLFLQVLHGT